MSAAEIRVYPNGPLVVRGPVELLDESGQPLELRRSTIALCRCGRSRSMPLCDGTHRAAGFRAAGAAPSAPGGDLDGHADLERPQPAVDEVPAERRRAE
jgi:CDGSH-type Zn-finger protein